MQISTKCPQRAAFAFWVQGKNEMIKDLPKLETTLFKMNSLCRPTAAAINDAWAGMPVSWWSDRCAQVWRAHRYTQQATAAKHPTESSLVGVVWTHQGFGVLEHHQLERSEASSAKRCQCWLQQQHQLPPHTRTISKSPSQDSDLHVLHIYHHPKACWQPALLFFPLIVSFCKPLSALLHLLLSLPDLLAGDIGGCVWTQTQTPWGHKRQHILHSTLLWLFDARGATKATLGAHQERRILFADKMAESFFVPVWL